MGLVIAGGVSKAEPSEPYRRSPIIRAQQHRELDHAYRRGVALRRRTVGAAQQVGARTADAYGSAAARGDSLLARTVGLKRPTTALLVGGTAVAATRRDKVGKAFATRDQNSSIGTTVTRKSPQGPGQTKTLHPKPQPAGRGRGVGRHLGRDQNSSPGAQRVTTPRSMTGQFVSHDNDLKVFHPTGRPKNRQPRDSALGRFGKKPSLKP